MGAYSNYFVYILSSHTGTLYTGMTNDLSRRIDQHKAKRSGSFSSKYNTVNLVYCEPINDLGSDREREAQIKRWARWKKVQLIDKTNPYWRDISESIVV